MADLDRGTLKGRASLDAAYNRVHERAYAAELYDGCCRLGRGMTLK